jgi:hypothetical protein
MRSSRDGGGHGPRDFRSAQAQSGLPIGRLAERGAWGFEDMPWGMHEFTLTDPSGNRIRTGRAIST